MNQYRIRRTTAKRHPQFFIRRSEIAFDEKVKYVESVCQVLIESRFGPGCVDPVIIDLSDRPEPGAAVFYALSENGEMIPSYALSPHRRAGFQVVEAAYRRAKQMGLVDARPNADNSSPAVTPNQGRGSP
ncbi:MAG: hypothetical protein ACKVRN_05265 [Pyrinomonadaceae bacterium]